VHERVSVSAVSSWQWSFDDDLAFWARAGITQVGLSLRKCDEFGLDRAVARVVDAGVRVTLAETTRFRGACGTSLTNRPTNRSGLRRPT